MIVWRIKSIGESSVYGRIFNKKYLLYMYIRCISAGMKNIIAVYDCMEDKKYR